MTRRNCKWTYRVTSLGFATMLWVTGGCAPTQFGPAIAYRAEKAAVTNAAARHTSASPFYRFNSALLSDLDDAIVCADAPLQHEKATAVLQKANALALASSVNEIDRMPVETRKELAELAQISDSRSALRQHYGRLASATLEQDLQEIDGLSSSGLQEKLERIRKGVEKLPDDRGRLARKAMLFWGIIPTAKGIAREEAHLPGKARNKARKKFERVALWHPSKPKLSSLLSKYAPIIGVEWGNARPYDIVSDRIGAVEVEGSPGAIDVHIDTANPTVYAYTSSAKIHGKTYQQLNYVWWFPNRPAFSKDDIGAGKIDGAMLRITLDSRGHPAIIESSLNCGCGHDVFISEKLESAAYDMFGDPLPGKRFSVEKDYPGKHDIVVIDTFELETGVTRPLLLTSSGYHEVIQVKFDALAAMASLEIAEDALYRLADYETLDALPLGDGIASMFGPDGLVHGAGRPEGFLLAPSGILSAGQPRKRGTQRIRWDDYLHDDPRLLEETLRLPPLD